MTREEAIKEIKSWDFLEGKEIEAIQTLIPELAESEDEMIRKLLVWQVYRNIEDETNDLAQSVYDGIKGHDPDLEESIEDWKKCLAWLEKQKEQKPVSISCGHENDKLAEWSEEDKENLNSIISCLNRSLDGVIDTVEITNVVGEIAWLKSLRPSWKPSEEQMDRLFSIVAALRKDYCDDMADFLANLYTDLEKLGVKEEPEY